MMTATTRSLRERSSETAIQTVRVRVRGTRKRSTKECTLIDSNRRIHSIILTHIKNNQFLNWLLSCKGASERTLCWYILLLFLPCCCYLRTLNTRMLLMVSSECPKKATPRHRHRHRELQAQVHVNWCTMCWTLKTHTHTERHLDRHIVSGTALHQHSSESLWQTSTMYKQTHTRTHALTHSFTNVSEQNLCGANVQRTHEFVQARMKI